MNTIKIPIRGMHCASCEIIVADELKKVPGVTKVRVSQTRAAAEIYFSGERPADDALKQAVKAAGYEIGEAKKLSWISRRPSDYLNLLLAGIILAFLFWLARAVGLPHFAAGGGGLVVALAVGLIAGISTCMALVGGLVLGLASRHAELHPEATAKEKFRPHLFFNLGRVGGYALLGGAIGLVGKAFRPSAATLAALTIGAGLVMIFFGLKLVGVFPALSKKAFTLPAGLARSLGIGKETKKYSHRGAIFAGVLTFFLPCGFTQAMQVYAVSTGSFWRGAATMGLFALGTAPGLIGIGAVTSLIKGRAARIFFAGAGLAVFVLGWFNLANGLNLIGSAAPKPNAQNIVAEKQTEKSVSGAIQEVRMTQSANGYQPNVFNIIKGRPVKWIINSTSPYSCASSIMMPRYGINQGLKAGENIITFTPSEAGVIPFSCSMGMYRGEFIVADVSGAAVFDWYKTPSPLNQ